MDGETALKYARSRNAEGDEGTDLARSERQQQIVREVFAKITSPTVFTSPMRMNRLYYIFYEDVETDLEKKQLAAFIRLIFNYKNAIYTHSIPKESLVVPEKSPEYDDLYVFIPKGDSWEEIQEWFGEIITN